MQGQKMNYASEIKSRVKMPEMVERYGYKIKQNRIPCPLHGGRDANCGVKENYIHCFVCGESADQISFVQKLFGLSFPDAIAKINEDFALGLPIGQRVEPRRRLEMGRAAFMRRKQQEAKKNEKEALEAAYWKAFDELQRLELQKQRYQPKSATDEMHPLFIQAVKNIERVKYELGKAQEDIYYYEKQQSD